MPSHRPASGRSKASVEPDVPVPPCRTYCAGRDPQLEKALELIEGELGRDG